jgi:hypothetical protein
MAVLALRGEHADARAGDVAATADVDTWQRTLAAVGAR